MSNEIGPDLKGLGMDLVLLLARLGFDCFSLALLLAFAFPYRVARSLLLPQTQTLHQPNESVVIITGASSGIGEALARKYAAAAPKAHLLLIAYNDEENLKRVQRACLQAGCASVEIRNQDVADRQGMEELVRDFDDKHPITLVIANAGITPKVDGIRESREVLDVNLFGALNTILPCLERMRERKRGQVVLVSSLAGYSTPSTRYLIPYVASKQAIRVYGEGLRAMLKQEGIGVTVVCPGFTKSKMVDALIQNGCNLLSLWETNDAATYIKQGIDQNLALVAFPTHMYVITRVLGNLPTFLREWFSPFAIANDPFEPMDRVAQKLLTKKAN